MDSIGFSKGLNTCVCVFAWLVGCLVLLLLCLVLGFVLCQLYNCLIFLPQTAKCYDYSPMLTDPIKERDLLFTISVVKVEESGK